MLLRNSFYKIEEKTTDGTAVIYKLLLNAGHVVYQAHFPDEPVTPGVCILQILRELLEDHTGVHLVERTVRNVKFLAVLSPVQNPRVEFVFDKIAPASDLVTVQAHVQAGDMLISKMSVIYMSDE